MFYKILAKIKKIIKPVAAKIAAPLVWISIFINFYILKIDRNCLPVFLINLCINDSLVFKLDPVKIDKHIEDPDVMSDRLFVWSGDWQKRSIDIWQHEKFDLMEELVVERKKYTDTRFFSLAMEEIKKGCPLSRGNIILDSEEKIIKYFKKQERLYEKIRSEGFIVKNAPETGVAVTRDGQLIHYRQGHHTLAIAKILKVDEVVVRIRAVHRLWMIKQLKTSGFGFLKSLKRGIEKIKGQ
jgi:hypothetical protein